MSLCLRGFVVMARSFVLRRFAGMFQLHRLRGSFDERFTGSSRRLGLWFHIRRRAGRMRAPRRKATRPADDAARHNWLVLERAIVKSLENVGRYVSLRETAR